LNASETRQEIKPRVEGLLLLGIALLFVALGVGYSLVVPPFEKPDEVYHYAFARHLAQGNGLPVQEIGSVGPWEHEGAQAPLYYFLVGRLTAGINQDDFPDLNIQNPRANLGNPLYPGNKNLMLYSGVDRPLSGANLALHVGRWFSIALGLLTLLFVYLTARLAFPASAPARLFVTLIVASIPQFAFISSSLSNDNLVIVVSMAAIWWLARLVSRSAAERVMWWEWAALGALLGLAALSKLQGLVLLAPIGIVALWVAWQRRSMRSLLASVALIALPALAIAGWWYWRNFQLYGDLLGAERLLAINGLRREPLDWPGFVGEMRGLRYSFWGLFGWFNLLMPTWVYRVIDAMTLLALAGFTVAAARAVVTRGAGVLSPPTARTKALLAFWAVTLVASMVYWATFATSSQGRLLFPAMSAFGVIFVVGLLTWLNFAPRWRWPLMSVAPAALVACSAYALLILLPAGYARPAQVASVPEGARPVGILYDNLIELVAVALPEDRRQPGDEVPVTLYLRSEQAPDENWQLFIQILDEDRQAIGNVTTHPGWGRNPTSLWTPGAIYEDRYLVRIDEPIAAGSPLLANVYVGFIRPERTEPAPAVDAAGQPVEGIVGQVAVEPWEPLDTTSLGLRPFAAAFEQGIRLTGVNFPETVAAGERVLPVTLLYESDGEPDGDYTAFLHLVDEAGNPAKGYDQPPAGTRFPTRAWRSGDRIAGEFAVLLPGGLAPGRYQLWTGLYRSDSQGEQRLPVVESAAPVEDMRVLLGTVEVK
jgi:hypothetical protein